MAERPIIFGTPMVQALLAGRKSQTRRVIARANSTVDGSGASKRIWEAIAMGFPRAWVDPGIGAGPHLKVPWEHPDCSGDEMVCRVRPRVEVGDVLWVREALVPDGFVTMYNADGEPVLLGDMPAPWRWKVRHLTARYCPRWASRLSRRVAEVRIERVQDIGWKDALAEGVFEGDERTSMVTLQSRFARLWDSINGKRPGCSWAANPWIFVYGFEAVDG